MAPSLIDIQLTNVAGRRAISARDEEEGDLEDVRLLDSYDEEAAGTREEEEKEARRIQVRVTGMTCSACTSAVEGAISALPGVVRATVSLLQNKAHVVFDPSRVKVRSIFFSLLLMSALYVGASPLRWSCGRYCFLIIWLVNWDDKILFYGLCSAIWKQRFVL